MKPGHVVGERFAIEATAGSGGMGVVYRALDRRTGVPVALKVLHGRAADGDVEAARFDREALLLAELRHPAIVGYVAHGRADAGQPFLAMEWLEGESLAARLKRAPLSIEESLALAERVAGALGEAHRRGIVHRDVKPGNLHLVDGAVEGVKVLDFGIASARGLQHQTLTATGAMIGTPGYMAPEQARGQRGIDGRADVFSLGCVLYRCVAGRAPFQADDMMAMLLKVVLEDPPHLASLRDVPAALDDLVARMLSKDPGGRPADGNALAAELAAIRSGAARATPAHASPPGAAREDDAPTVTRAPTALTAGERRVVCLVLARPAAAEAGDDAPTHATGRAGAEGLREILARAGARLDTLADGALLATVDPSTTGAATDHAARAARAALAMAAALPGAAVAMVAGRAVTDRGIPVGAIVERGVALLNFWGRAAGVRLDADAAALVERGFHVERDAGGPRLVAEHDVPGHARQLLGKPTPCVGREKELALLEGLYDEAVAEPAARAAIVTGAPGVGKSRLRLELLARLRRRDDPPEVWVARAESMTSGSPFGLLGPMIRRVVGVRDGEPPDTARSKLAERVFGARVDPADADRVARFLGELAGVPFPDDGCPALASARRDPRLMGDQMRNAFEDWVRAECASPLVIVLEDLHWGDLPSMSFVETLLARLVDRPLLVLGLARPSVYDVFPKLWAERAAQEVRLGPLPKRASEELARAVLGGRASPEAVARVVDLAAGNAFYLEELIRAVAEGARELPDTVLAMVEARIEGLDAEARRALRAAGVLGSAAWPGAVAALLGAEDAGAARAEMAQLARKELLTARRQSRFAGEEEYAFRHALVRDAAYATLTDQDRALGHRIAGAWLEAAGERDSAVLADHYERGGDLANAARHYLSAAEKALEGSDNRTTAALAERALALGVAEGEARGKLLALQTEARAWLGDFDVAERAGLEAMSLLRPASAPWYGAAHALIAVFGVRHESARLQALLGSVGELTHDDDAVEACAVMLVMGTVRLLLAGLSEGAEATFAQLEALRRRSSKPLVAAAYGSAVTMRALSHGDPFAAASAAEPAAAALLAHGQRRFATQAILMRAIALNELGAFDTAERCFREAADLVARTATYAILTTLEHNWGLSLLRLGRLGEALEVERRALARAEEKHRTLVSSCHRYLARILLAAGDLDGAARHAEQATDAAAPGRPPFANALATRALVELARGHPDAALSWALRGRAALEALGAMDEGESVVRLALVEALHASGRHDEARDEAARARQRLFERAAAIHDEALVRSFLGAVPENARLLELARTLAGDAPQLG